MKIIFAGTPEFAAKHLQALIDSKHEICAVYTQPDKPKGRGRKLIATPVKQVAQQAEIPVFQPTSLRGEAVQKQLAGFKADVMVVVAYGLILPAAVLTTPRFGCLNVHASLLPKWRGAAPIQHAVLAGDSETGITIMQMDTGLDTGDMLYKTACAIKATDTADSLHDRLAELGKTALLKTLTMLEQGELQPEAQASTQACYAAKLSKQQAQIDWTQPASVIERQIRAYNPWPVAFTYYERQPVRIWEASVIDKPGEAVLPGELIAVNKKTLDVATGDYALRITKLQLPGSKPLTVADVLNGNKIQFEAGKYFTNES